MFNEVETSFISFNAGNITKYGYNTQRAAINGRSFGTLPGLNMSVGDRYEARVGDGCEGQV